MNSQETKVFYVSNVYRVPDNPHPLRDQLISYISSGKPIPDYSTCQICHRVRPICEVKRAGRLDDTVCEDCRRECGEPDEGWIPRLAARLDALEHRACGACQLVMPIAEFDKLRGYWVCGLCMMHIFLFRFHQGKNMGYEKLKEAKETIARLERQLKEGPR